MALVSRSLRACWVTWCETAAALSESRAVMLSVAQSLRHRGVRMALNAWYAKACMLSEQRDLLTSAVTAFFADGARRSWNSWVEYCDEAQMRSQLLGGALRSLRSMGVRGAACMCSSQPPPGSPSAPRITPVSEGPVPTRLPVLACQDCTGKRRL